MIYAMLDQSPIVRAEHLLAALAIWTYCEESARYIFGSKLGDSVADTVLEELKRKPEGLTRTEISNLFGRHQTKERIDLALQNLVLSGFAVRKSETTGGRSVERWVFSHSEGAK